MKMSILYKFLIFLFFSLSLFANESKQKVLILHSYHQSYKWTDDITEGIYSILKNKQNSEIKFYIEYMDTKRFVDNSYYKNLLNLYKNKYENIKFDLIIASDNNAFEFLKKYNKSLFDTNVIFCGVNYLKPAQLKGFDKFTGVSEEANIKRNFDLIIRLHPKVQNLYIVLDTTTTGKVMKEEISKIIKNYQYTDINFHILDDVTTKELQTKVTNLPSNSVILMTIFLRTKDDKFLEYYEASELINRHSKAPLYGLWDFNIGHGIIGGFLTSGYHQGRNAALMAKKILDGEDIKNIKPLYKSPNQYIFDYTQIQNYELDIKMLPSISTIINKPDTMYEKYKKEIMFLIILFILMSIFIVLLLINIQRRKTAQLETKRQLKFQQDLIDNVHAPIYYKDNYGEYMGCNKAFEEFIGLTKVHIIGKTVYDLVPKKIADIYKEKDEELLRAHKSQEYESVYEDNNQKLKQLKFYKNIFYDEDIAKGIIGAIFDITELKDITIKLNELNKKLEEKVKQRTIQIETTNKELEVSNKELSQTINNLKETQDKLITSEKMASLGGLVAGVAHEINTPVGIGVTGISHFLEVSKQIKAHYEKDEMTQEEFEEFLETTNTLAKSININLQRTAKLIKSFKQISVDQTNEEKRYFFVLEYIQEILLSISNITKKTNIQINVDCNENIKIDSYPGALSQIITNLIVNSTIHAYKPKSKGKIDITFEVKENKAYLTYKDDGKGIKKEHLEKIFDPFFTTNRGKGGTGLGLNIIYNIVVSTLNGSINCKSKEDEGTQFDIVFPI